MKRILTALAFTISTVAAPSASFAQSVPTATTPAPIAQPLVKHCRGWGRVVFCRWY